MVASVKFLLAPVRSALRSRRHWLRYYRLGILDGWDRVARRRQSLVPPRRLIFLVGGNFQETGERFVRFLIDRAGLRPDDAVLDVGCGTGRMAVPLTRYLSAAGTYEGFDSFVRGVRWCAENVTPRFPNFRFQVADLYNEFYTPRGRYKASEYRFPYPDASFDVVFLASVFTHLLPDDMENYLAEVARVLKPGGRCVITYFLLNPETDARSGRGETDLNFRFNFGRYRSINETGREAAVAFEEEAVRRLYDRNHLRVQEPIERGSWSGIDNPLTYQDIVVASKQTGSAHPA